MKEEEYHKWFKKGFDKETQLHEMEVKRLKRKIKWLEKKLGKKLKKEF